MFGTLGCYEWPPNQIPARAPESPREKYIITKFRHRGRPGLDHRTSFIGENLPIDMACIVGVGDDSLLSSFWDPERYKTITRPANIGHLWGSSECPNPAASTCAANGVPASKRGFPVSNRPPQFPTRRSGVFAQPDSHQGDGGGRRSGMHLACETTKHHLAPGLITKPSDPAGYCKSTQPRRRSNSSTVPCSTMLPRQQQTQTQPRRLAVVLSCGMLSFRVVRRFGRPQGPQPVLCMSWDGDAGPPWSTMQPRHPHPCARCFACPRD